MRAIRSRLLGLIAGAALLLLIGAATRSAAASDDAIVTTLYPGWNLIGWIEADSLVDAVFDELPALSMIRGDEGRVARSGGLNSLREFDSLRTGHGYWFHISATQNIEWRRDGLTPAERVARPAGQHLVAWNGRDGIAFASAVRGIAESTRLAWTWDGARQRWRIWNAQAARNEAPDETMLLRRGDGVSLSLHSPIYWRQPTGVLPPVEFIGEVPQGIRDQVMADLRYVTRYFADRFGVEADPSQMRVLIPRSIADLNNEVPEDHEIGRAYASALLGPNPGDTSRIIMTMGEWAPYLVDLHSGRSYNGRVTLLHEYFHVVQFHLAGSEMLRMPNWLIEGGPTWLMHEAGLDPSGRYGSIDSRLLEASQFVIRDRDRRAGFDHALGMTAMRWLVERSDADSYLAFWRHLAMREGARPTWPHAFEAAFGIPLGQFYTKFEAWMRRANPFVEGFVRTSARIDPSDVRLWFLAEKGRRQQAKLEADGRFRVALPAHDSYQVFVGVGETRCTGYLTENGEIGSLDSATYLKLGEGSVSNLSIQIPQSFCSIPIRGSLTVPNPDLTKFLKLLACNLSSGCAETVARPGGRFEFTVPRPGTYLVSITDSTGQCRGYLQDGALTAHRARATRIAVSERGFDELQIRVPATLCSSYIHGRLLNLGNEPERGNLLGSNTNRLWVRGCASAGGICTHAEIEADGSFALQVPTDERFDLRLQPMFWPEGLSHRRCFIDYPEPVRASEADLAGIRWDVPTDFCRWRVEGSLTSPDGAPFSRFPIAACRPQRADGEWTCGGRSETNADGSFRLYIPYDDAFVVRPAPVRECPGGNNEAYHLDLHLNGGNISELRWVLPDDVCSLTASLKRGSNWNPLP